MIRTIFLVIVSMFSLLVCSCTTTKYLPVERVKTEYVEADTTAIYDRLMRMFESMRKTETRNDSLVDYGRETVVLNESGDTTRHDRERIVYRSTNREMELEQKVSTQDSIIDALRLQLTSVKSDSIPVPYPVERQLSRWERTKVDWGGWAMLALAVIIASFVWFWKRKI